MFGQLALAALWLPLALAAPSPSKRGGSPLSCVQYQYSGPFASFGLNGFIHLYGNVTQFDPDTQTTSFNETRLGLADDGTIQNCGDCRSTQQFGFEVCQGPDRKGFNGLGNSATDFYGHVLYTTDQADIQCLTATKPYNGSSLTVSDCQYDYANAGDSGQYFQIASSTGVFVTRLVTAGETFGINPSLNDGAPLTLYDGPATGPFTYLGWKE